MSADQIATLAIAIPGYLGGLAWHYHCWKRKQDG